MDPHSIFRPNIGCPARGRVCKANIHVHSEKNAGQRFIFIVCATQPNQSFDVQRAIVRMVLLSE